MRAATSQGRWSFVTGALLLGALACGGPADDVADRERAPDTPPSPAAGGADTAGAHGHDAAPGQGQTLLVIMRDLGAELSALTYALMAEDFEAVMRSATAIAGHAPISPAELERISAELGAEMQAFEALDEAVHDASVRLEEAARSRQPETIAQRLADVQAGCVSCHTRFRERLRTTATR